MSYANSLQINASTWSDSQLAPSPECRSSLQRLGCALVGLACIGLLPVLWSSRADAEPTSSVSTLLKGKSAQIRVCDNDEASKTMCEEIALALTREHSALAHVDPKIVVPDSDDSRMNLLGGSCPPSGADVRGDPYLPFELEYDGWQAIAAGPFEVFTISEYYPKWREHQVVAAAGYDYENPRLSTGHPLSWKAYYMVPTNAACPLILLDVFFHRGREQASRQKVGDDLYVWQGRVLLVTAEERPLASDSYYVSVSLIPQDPPAAERSRGPLSTHLVSFTAQ